MVPQFLQEGAGQRIAEDGLRSAGELYSLETVTRHGGFTSLQVRPHHVTIHEIGMQYILQLELSIQKDKQ